MHARQFLVGLIVSVSLPAHVHAQPAERPASRVIVVKAGKLLDVRKGSYLEHAAILIDGERIKEVGPADAILPHAPQNVETVDWSHATVLPGLIDCHTHLLARFSNEHDGYVLGLATKSEAFRALEGAADARLTLYAGFTTVRDVESEGAGYADVALRDAINRRLVEGPRMQVATRGIAAVGQYNPFGVSPDLMHFPTGAQMVSGTEEARRAVREQIGHGADLIKVYADWEHPTLTVEEMRVIVEEAHKQARKVAAHANSAVAIKNAIAAGVDSIEHGHGADREALEMMKDKGVFLVPTVGGMDDLAERLKRDPLTPAQIERLDKRLQGIREMLQSATRLGVKMASGFDGSSEGAHGRNAAELIAMASRGVPPADVFRAATVNAAELLGWQNDVGAAEPGKYADLIAVEGDPLAEISVLKQVKYVMKGGVLMKPPGVQ